MPSARFIAVELEVNDSSGRLATIDVASEWGSKIVSDGSLPSTGWEFNSFPASGSEFERQLRDTCNAMREDGAEVARCCGYHVHVDARDFNHTDIANLIRVYAKIETALFACVAPSRRTNHYCAKCGPMFLERLTHCTSLESDDAKTSRVVYSAGVSHLKKAKRDKYDQARYAALNLHSWVYRGTVECRLHHGTVKYERVLRWAALWASILDYAKSNPASSLDGLTSWDALMAIAPNEETKTYLRQRADLFHRDPDTSNQGE